MLAGKEHIVRTRGLRMKPPLRLVLTSIADIAAYIDASSIIVTCYDDVGAGRDRFSRCLPPKTGCRFTV